MSSAQAFVPYAFARDNAILLKPTGERDAEVWISESTPLAALNEVMRVFPGRVKPIVVASDKLSEAIAQTYSQSEGSAQQIVGDIEDEHDEARPRIVRRGRSIWEIDGLASIADVERETGLSLHVADSEAEVDTLGGLVLSLANRVPATGETIDLSHPGGIPEFLEKLVADGQKPKVGEVPFHLARTGESTIEVALQWTESTDEVIRSYVNGIRTSDGGTHEKGFKDAIVKAVRNFMETHGVKDKKLDITANDIREGIVGVLSVFVREPMFQGQTKERLNNPEMTSVVERKTTQTAS